MQDQVSQVAFLYATFPRQTETFVRRELRSLYNLGFSPHIYSIWQGDTSWEGKKVGKFCPRQLLCLFYLIPYWAWKKPSAFKLILEHIFNAPCPNLQNWNETFWGFAFGLIQAGHFKAKPYHWIHAVWATMPATSALVIHLLVHIRFSMGAHAYDVFRDGGDWLLDLKLRRANFVRTSSNSTAVRLRLLGLNDQKLNLIPRSLTHWPQRHSFSLKHRSRISLLSVGRLVPKKGYYHLLKIASLLVQSRIPFKISIVGAGPLSDDLICETKRLNLQERVFFLGSQKEDQLKHIFSENDAFLFTGIIDEKGDRDGIPNVILEAMAAGLLVIASNRAGASEAFVDGKSGFSLDPNLPHEWVKVLGNFCCQPENFTSVRKKAQTHARERFDSVRNATMIRNQFPL